jgi:hypothetical protein
MVSGLFAKLGISYAISQRVIYTLPFLVIAIAGTRALARRLGTDSRMIIIGVFLLLANYAVIDWYAGGWATTLIALSMIPLIISLELKWIETPTSTTAFFIGFLLGLLILLDVRDFIIITILNIPLIVSVVGSSTSRRMFWRQSAAKRIGHLGIAALALFLIILPQLTTIYVNSSRHLGGAILPSAYYNISNLSQFSYYSLADTMSLFNPWWPYFRFFDATQLQPIPALNIWPILVVAGMTFTSAKSVATRNIRLVGLWAYLLGSAFASGVDSPFRPLNRFLWTQVPGFNLFRNPELWTQLPLLGVLLIILTLTPVMSGDVEGRSSSSATSVRGAFQWTQLLVPLLVSGVLLQGMLISIESVRHPANNLASHTSTYTSRIINFLDHRQGSVLWIPTSPAIAYQHLISSAHLNGVPLNSWLSVATFPDLKSENVASGGPLYPELFSTRTTAWSFINRFRIGYLVVDRFDSPWASVGLNNLHDGTELSLRALGLDLVAQNAQYAVYQGNSAPVIDVGVVNGITPLTSRQLQLADFPPNSFHLSASNLSGQSPYYGAGTDIPSESCPQADTQCLIVTRGNSEVTLQSSQMAFSLLPGERVRFTPELDLSRASTSTIQANLVCQGVPVATVSIQNSGGASHGVYDFEYSDNVPLSHCFTSLNVTSPSPLRGAVVVGVRGLRVETIPPLAPQSNSASSNIASGGTVKVVSKLNFHIADTAQDSWKLTIGSSSKPRVVDLWQSFSPGWRLNCPNHLGGSGPQLTNGWAMSFNIPAGGETTCSLNFPPQSTIDLAVLASMGGLLVALAGLVLQSRRRRTRTSSTLLR